MAVGELVVCMDGNIDSAYDDGVDTGTGTDIGIGECMYDTFDAYADTDSEAEDDACTGVYTVVDTAAGRYADTHASAGHDSDDGIHADGESYGCWNNDVGVCNGVGTNGTVMITRAMASRLPRVFMLICM